MIQLIRNELFYFFPFSLKRTNVMITKRRGLKIPLSFTVNQAISVANPVSRVALLGADYPGMKPSMIVKVGDSVQIGEKLFEDKKNPGVFFTAPAAGKVVAINRGDKRAFISLEIEIDPSEKQVSFSSYKQDEVEYSPAEIRSLLLESGLWTSIIQRPFAKIPKIDDVPDAIVVQAINTHPLAPDLRMVVEENKHLFDKGVEILSRLTNGTLYVAQSKGSILIRERDNIKLETFIGPHPIGTQGMLVHHLFPASEKRKVWSVDAQDVLAIGELFSSGKLKVDRVVSLAGYKVNNPRLLKTRLGASTDDLLASEVSGCANCKKRFISGSLLFGRILEGSEKYLGRYSSQVTVLKDAAPRNFLGWLLPGVTKFSIKAVFASALFPLMPKTIDTQLHGSPRAMVPVGSYEKVFPGLFMPTQLLRSILTKNYELAVKLGVLELSEEDISTLTFVDPGKIDYAPLLREMLDTIEKEGV